MKPKTKTNSEMYGPAMTITDQKEADAYFEELVKYFMACFGQDRVEAESILRHNLGYYAGYYSNETREQVERLFKCVHPVFGSIKDNGAPTAEQAFKAGLAAGKAMKKGKA